tara:strand:- start:4260 stop:5084 length:825 start_codon:yes stop_codon:yes gene_type:complete
MNKEYNLKDSLTSGDLGVSLMQFLSEHYKKESVLGTKEEDIKLKIDMYIDGKACQVKTDYYSHLTGHAAIELAEINFSLKDKQFGGTRPGSYGVMCNHCDKQVIKPQRQPNVTAGALLQQPLLDNCSNLIYIMPNVGVIFYNPKTLNTALWYWMKNHTNQDKVNDKTWQIQPAPNPNYISLSLLMPHSYLTRKQEVIVKKGYASQQGESYMVEPYKFITWPEIQNLIISEDRNRYWQPMMNNVKKFIDYEYNKKIHREMIEDAFGIQLLHKSVY